MGAKQFCQIFGVVLLLIGIVGFLVPSLGPLHFTMHHNLIHLASGALLAWAGFAGSGGAARTMAQLFGVVYGLVTVLGFLGYANLGPIQLHLNTPYNVIHLVITVFALWAGFGKRG
jgi:hypothetical protein